jgi:hypothetical protein
MNANQWMESCGALHKIEGMEPEFSVRLLVFPSFPSFTAGERELRVRLLSRGGGSANRDGNMGHSKRPIHFTMMVGKRHKKLCPKRGPPQSYRFDL